MVMRETRLEKPVKSIAKEISDLSAVHLNVVALYNMFTEENAKDRGMRFVCTSRPEYMQDVRGDVEAQCSEYGTITGLAIDEQTRVVRVRYASEKEAIKCKEALDGHVYDGRRMTVELERDPTVLHIHHSQCSPLPHRNNLRMICSVVFSSQSRRRRRSLSPSPFRMLIVPNMTVSLQLGKRRNAMIDLNPYHHFSE